MLRFLLIACLVAVVPLHGRANPTAEIEENDFLDLVDSDGNVLIQAQGVDAVNAEARSQGLALPALGYRSPESHCFVKPAPGDCDGGFKRQAREAPLFGMAGQAARGYPHATAKKEQGCLPPNPR